MAPTAHSQFSASASARLLSCPGSFLLGQQHDTGRRSTVYSSEGTLAHAISEACLQANEEPENFVGQTREADGYQHEVDDDFAEAVRSYVDFVRGLKALDYTVALETKVSPQVLWGGLPPLKIELFGTSDCIAYNPEQHHLVVGDLKFGKGIAVEAAHNTQLLYYAAGALGAVPENRRATLKVTTVIIQPRAHHPAGPVRSHEYTGAQVIEWARIQLYDGVKRAMADNGQSLFAGKWCRFCPAFAHCTKPRDLAMETARQAFLNAPLENIPAVDEPGAQLPAHELSDAKLGELLDKIEVVSPWFDAVRELGLERMERGRNVPGWKAVPKRALRRWADDEAVIVGHLSGILRADEYSTSKLLTPAQIEKKLGKDRYAALVGPHVVKTSSGLTLAPDGDPRVRVRAGRTAQEAFASTPAINQVKG